MSLSICIPTWQRFEMTIISFEQVLHDDRVDEVVIVDDFSTDGSYDKLVEHFKDEPKVKLYQNSYNLDCYFNKKRAVELASNEWCCLWDSDNIFGKDYLDCLFDYVWDEKIIFAPVYAMPNFDYRAFSKLTVSQHNVAGYMSQHNFATALNTMNFFVNRNQFLDVWDGSLDPVTSDSLYFNYCWLKAGNKIHFLEGLEYFHRVHDQSHYQNNVHRTINGFHSNLEAKLKKLF